MAPFLEEVSGFSRPTLGLPLFVFGVAAAIRDFAAGPIASAAVGLALLAVVLSAMASAGQTKAGAVIGW
ncbi:putative MFS family arabinose efflux permease [Streptomyces aurantiacus]|uniref:hypothetical protein n=1 Tax=Streptomyces aurantiacus TaxID=47760 RepID=UPI00278F15C7|nr:hypothetical protein [Streptomyces aurantiacus]MDQ0771733.1 putative MFS family arabinose efflux permease [Streptomyces aurantiacus]